MSKESFPALTWRRHQECLNPCDPKKGAFRKILERQQRENGIRHSQIEEIKKTSGVNISIPAGASDTKEQEN